MCAQAARATESEEKIIQVLMRNRGNMSIERLVKAVSDAGVNDDVLIRSSIWHLISQSRIERNADNISIRRTRAAAV
jgi:hypothetical protein